MNATTKSVCLAFFCFWIESVPGLILAQEKSTPTKKEEIPKASVQIVNAISTPEVSLSINGKELYPQFPQGLYTADAPLAELKPQYLVSDPLSKRSAEFRVELEPTTNQSLVMIGDFSVPEDSSLYLPGVLKKNGDSKANSTGPESNKPKPNILFLVFSHKLSDDDTPLRYRVINGMPGTSLTLDTGKEGPVIVEPGTFYQLNSQKPTVTLSVFIQDKSYPVFINQQGLERNALIIFFKTAQGPVFMRAFENTKQTFKILEDMEAEKTTPPKP